MGGGRDRLGAGPDLRLHSMTDGPSGPRTRAIHVPRPATPAAPGAERVRLVWNAEEALGLEMPPAPGPTGVDDLPGVRGGGHREYLRIPPRQRGCGSRVVCPRRIPPPPPVLLCFSSLTPSLSFPVSPRRGTLSMALPQRWGRGLGGHA